MVTAVLLQCEEGGCLSTVQFIQVLVTQQVVHPGSECPFPSFCVCSSLLFESK